MRSTDGGGALQVSQYMESGANRAMPAFAAVFTIVFTITFANAFAINNRIHHTGTDKSRFNEEIHDEQAEQI